VYNFQWTYKICQTTAILLIYSIFILTTKVISESDSSRNSFDGWRAFDYIKTQCGMGPRVPGTPAHQKCLDWMKQELEKAGFETRVYTYSGDSKLLREKIQIKNLFGIIGGDAKRKIMISAHWDTRPISDKDPNPNLREVPILGANDGASGVAVLLELARVLGKSNKFEDLRTSSTLGVILAFYDGEDLGTPEYYDDYCLGSKAFADSIPADMAFEEGINIDMIGDSDLSIYMEKESLSKFPDLTNRFWEIGARIDSRVFIPQARYSVTDDHSSFFSKKIPYINVIDFDYPYWHTQDDTPDKCSAQSLQIVGNTILNYIEDKIKKIRKKT